ncbi:oxidoreductase [Virgisporangium aliadipatigenens]|uniref:Oxidoreductase n=1 Tax=Virgisporangium aliadipatigenens TaxID=741659 RepID=A0A8J4DUM6_9ACTN|nr:oxidoreductase [Virgisporangium aliadipatigenens]
MAIVGTGNIARFHVEALRSLDAPVRIVAGVDLDAGLATSFCAAHGIPFADTDVERALTHTRPDVVHVCTPPGAHLAPARAALNAGAHVVVEKPPTLSLRDFDALADAQPAGGPYVATVFQHRFGSGARRIRALLDAGVLGRPLVARCDTLWYRPDAYFDPPWRGRWETEGGGPTMGHGIHQMDLLSAVLGEWTRVSALARRQARRTATEDLSVAHVSFANGAVASVVNSLLSPREESYLRFDFEYATVELTHLYGYGDDDWRVTPAPGHEESVTAAWKAGEHGRNSGHAAQFALVADAVREGSVPPVDTAEARRTMTLVAGVYASAFGGRPVGPDDVGPGSPHYENMRGDGPPWTEET